MPHSAALKGKTTKRIELELVRSQLYLERSSWLPHWRDISNLLHPRRFRFTISEANRGERKNNQIIDNTAATSSRTLRSGMVGGITSPARPWFRVGVSDPQLREVESVRDWLHEVTALMQAFLLRSNYYNVKPLVYGDMGDFGTGVYSIEEDFENVIHCTSFPVGSYMLGKDAKGRVNTFVRDFRMTISQVVEMFAQRDPDTQKIKNWDNFSIFVKNEWDLGNFHSWVDIAHIIKPNRQFDPNRLESKFKKYESTYWERGGNSNAQTNTISASDVDKYLRESGFDMFPILAPRWEITGEDVYGTNCPGMISLGDNKQLHWLEKKIQKAIDKMIDPPTQAPTSLKGQKASILPGDITYVDVPQGQHGITPIHEVQFRVDIAEAKQEQIRSRIKKAFYEDLFLFITQDVRNDRATAFEIQAGAQERLIVLGPVLEQLNQDDLDPTIDILFDIMNRQGLLPEAPEELQGERLKIEYISVMAQAQKSTDLGSIERFTNFVVSLAAVDSTVLHKVDFDQAVDEYGDAIGISPKVIRSDDEVADLREGIAEAQASQQKAAQMEQTAGIAKTLSETDTGGGENALSGLLDQAGGGQ